MYEINLRRGLVDTECVWIEEEAGEAVSYDRAGKRIGGGVCELAEVETSEASCMVEREEERKKE